MYGWFGSGAARFRLRIGKVGRAVEDSRVRGMYPPVLACVNARTPLRAVVSVSVSVMDEWPFQLATGNACAGSMQKPVR
jgi:hypothetical protein